MAARNPSGCGRNSLMVVASPAVSVEDGSDLPDLDDLVRRSRSGDLEAFDDLVGRFYTVTFGLACRMLYDREAAADAVQEVFIKAWRNLPRFRSASRFSTWIHTIAVNHCLDTAR